MKNLFPWVSPVMLLLFVLFSNNTALADETSKILKAAPHEQIVLVEENNVVKAIGIGDTLADYGTLRQVHGRRLVFDKTTGAGTETCIVHMEDNGPVVTRITRTARSRPVQTLFQKGRQ